MLQKRLLNSSIMTNSGEIVAMVMTGNPEIFNDGEAKMGE